MSGLDVTNSKLRGSFEKLLGAGEYILGRLRKGLKGVILTLLLTFWGYFPPVCASPVDEGHFFAALKARSHQYGWNDLRISDLPWESYRKSAGGYPLVFLRLGDDVKNCVLFLGGVHGDEAPAVYLTFMLAQYLREHAELTRGKCIIVAPLVNPDGFLAEPPSRVNSRGIDINRNFPTRDWWREANHCWRMKAKGLRRYYPGRRPASEPETLFQVALIHRFKPYKILSIHSPLNFFDYDGPSTDLDSFEKWMEKMASEANHPLKKFGYFPGSLGNYAGHERGIFTVTLELPSSDPKEARNYFRRFQTVFMKFIDLPVWGVPSPNR
ncbi:MAG TPA: M14 family zinc carboxypeptidase [Syntrophales bacterium]|nr:M14 family zinc carboxypeptidase [Syntrophales bacterium]HOL58389.1 M14 family zinc carboxypeptidase [Syntrophales bacterium]HPO34558.1 M14 family zinc carboxypeptidase [Syntrophales bacterium]